MTPSVAPIRTLRSSPAPEEADWKAIGEEAVELLRSYIRFPTENDPSALSETAARETPWLAGREIDAAEWLRDQFEATGIRAELLASAPGRVNVVARLTGGGRGSPLILLSHSDVVPAVRREWSSGIDPFGAEVRDGFVYGRGVLDLKALGIIHLMTLRLLQQMGAAIDRDVVALIAADEEAGGRFGAQWVLDRRPELAKPIAVLGEGAYSLRGMGANPRPIQAIAVGEKGYLELELTVDAPSHHASMPAARNAPSRLVEALARVLRMKHPIRISAVSRQLIDTLAQDGGPLLRSLLAHPRMMAYVARRHAARNEVLAAMLQDTVAITVIAAGHKHNVVPGTARAILSIRYLPDTSPDELTSRVRQAIDDPAVVVETRMHKPATLSRCDNGVFAVLRKQAAAPRTGPVLSIVSPAASDCRFWRARGVPCYGWLPFVIPAEDLHRVRGADERLSVAAFQEGLRHYFQAVLELTRTSEGDLSRHDH
jgi:acetylornithine deacetylase/succinyl-diaminopimelate desuccinylase-like protein